MRIDELTREQKESLPRYAEEWTRIGICTEPADRPKAEAAIHEMYRCGGIDLPEKIIWCGSPLSMFLTKIAISHIDNDSVLAEVRADVRASVLENVRADVRASVRADVWASVRADVRASVRADVWAEVRESVWADVRADVWAEVRESVRASVWASVRADVRADVRASVRADVWADVFGQHDASWLAFYRVFHDFGLATETEKLSGLWALAQSAGWALPCKDICFVSERHTTLHLDDKGKLHCLTGPACAYPDGWSTYAIHGRRVPGWIIEHGDTLTEPEIISMADRFEEFAK